MLILLIKNVTAILYDQGIYISIFLDVKEWGIHKLI
jgi:hypothetical protein